LAPKCSGRSWGRRPLSDCQRAGFIPWGFASNGYGEHSPAGYSLLAGFCAEMVFAFMFLFIILGATDSRAPQGFAP
jgi:aquaporin Z